MYHSGEKSRNLISHRLLAGDFCKGRTLESTLQGRDHRVEHHSAMTASLQREPVRRVTWARSRAEFGDEVDVGRLDPSYLDLRNEQDVLRPRARFLVPGCAMDGEGKA